MTSPLSNTNLNPPLDPDIRRPGKRTAAEHNHGATPDPGPGALAKGRMAPPDSDRIHTATEARATLERIRAAIAASPREVLAAQGSLDAASISGTLRGRA